MLLVHVVFVFICLPMYSYLFDHDESGWTMELCVCVSLGVCLLSMARCAGFIPGRWLLGGGGGGRVCPGWAGSFLSSSARHRLTG